MKKPRVAVVNSTSFGKYSNAIERLRRLCEVDVLTVPKDVGGRRLAEHLKEIDIVIAAPNPSYKSDFFENNLDIASIIRHGTGIDNIDVDSATKSGVIVIRVPGAVEREAVAEHTIALILSAVRKIPQAHLKVKEGKWAKRAGLIGFEIKGKTIGIIGLGNIGGRVAEILIKGFNAKVLAYDPYLPEDRIRELGAVPVDFDTLLRESDIVTLHCPLTKDTYHIIDEEAFEKMREGAVLINTGRGKLVDTNALIKVLEQGKLSCVALDVMENEPIDGNHPLLKFENVIITPHIAANTFESLMGMDEHVVKAINSLLSGEVPEGVVNREVFGAENLRLRRLIEQLSLNQSIYKRFWTDK
ncbi:MAG: D-isomer specific 2-hydroxyacid dehydrogenase family protein [Nitrososphaeria archaeon]|nr:D-isomer specific 2-hydroxyacid dehydrogenase family protein [Nitrososphaeria archaeon]